MNSLQTVSMRTTNKVTTFLVMNKIFDTIHIIIPYAWVPRLTESTTFLQVQSVFTHVASIYANLLEQQKMRLHKRISQ